MKRMGIFVMLCVVVFGGSTGAWAIDVASSNLQSTITSAGSGETEIRLIEDITSESTITIEKGKNIILDLNGKTIIASKSGDRIDAIKNVGGILTIIDKTGGGVIKSDKHGGVMAMDDSTTTLGSQTNDEWNKFTIEGLEGAVCTPSYKKTSSAAKKESTFNATIYIYGGRYVASDNNVLAGNGTNSGKSSSNTWNIYGGTFEGAISSNGYIAGGIYAPHNDTWNIHGGTFNIEHGAGIVVRAGQVNIPADSTVKFITTKNGNDPGKVGDSRVVVNSSAIVLDNAAQYPGLNYGACKVNIAGGEFESDPTLGEIQVISLDEANAGTLSITGGTFAHTIPQEYIASGYKLIDFNGKYRVVSEADGGKAEETAKQAEQALSELAEDTTVANSEAGGFLAEKLTSTDPEEQAAALEFKDALTASLSSEEIATLSKEEAKVAYTNKLSADQAAQVEAQSGEVKDTTTPAGTDLLAASDTASEALKTANETLSAKPKVVAPTAITREAVKTLQNNLSLLETSKVADKAIDQKALEAVKNAAENLKTRNDIEILSAETSLAEQAKAIESVFEDVQENLASVQNAGGGNGVVIASVLPPMIPKTSGFFPLKINLRNLLPGRKLMFWPSTAFFNNYADSPAAANASLAAIDGDGTEGKEGDFFFLDENQVPVTKVTGDASKMTVVAYLEEEGDYSSAFITADATEKDVATLETLAADSSSGGGDSKPETPGGDSNSGGTDNNGGNDNNNGSGDDGKGGPDDGDGSDSSSGSGGGCEVGLGLWSIAAAIAAMKISKKH